MAINIDEIKGNVAVLSSVTGNAPGIKGAKGDTGETGPQGPQGPRGYQGERGKTGVVSQAEEPTDTDVYVWVDTDEEGLIVDSSGGTGKIDSISVNGKVQPIINKNVDIKVPTKVSDLEIPDTLYANGSDYAEYFQWYDGNPRKEDRRCLFVSIEHGTKMIKKAMLGDDILGITSIDASIIGNATYKDDSTCSAVGMMGVMRVKDNGKCQVGDYVIPGDNGIAIPSTNNVGYKVTARHSANMIEVLMAHDSEMISRLKDDVKNIEEEVQTSLSDVAKTNVNNNFSVSQTINGTLTINGDIVQNGEIYETHAEKLYTKNDEIITREGATGGLSEGEYTGIQAQLYDGTNNGRLGFNASGEARVGDIGDEQPLLTRDEIDNLTDGQLLKWDATNLKAVGTNEYVKNTDYATTTTGGVVRTNSTYGIGNLSDGLMYISKATESDIDKKTTQYRPIVPASLDYAVKSGLSNNQLEWTEEEKASARNLIGASTEVTLTQAEYDALTTKDENTYYYIVEE